MGNLRTLVDEKQERDWDELLACGNSECDCYDSSDPQGLNCSLVDHPDYEECDKFISNAKSRQESK